MTESGVLSQAVIPPAVLSGTVEIDTCRRLLDLDHTRQDVIGAVETQLGRNLRHPPTMAETARHLRITEHTLRRHLTAAGKFHSTIRNRVREQRSTFLLQESTLTIEDIVHETRFSEAREPRRAYVRFDRPPPDQHG